MKEVCFFIVLIIMACRVQAQIVAWHFNQAAGNEQVYDPTTKDQSLKNSSLVRGSGLRPSSCGRAFASANFTVNGTKADALRNDEYLSFTVNAVPGFVVSVYTLDTKLRRTIDGPTTYRWYYSLNGTDFSPVGENDIKIAVSEDGIIQPRINLYNMPSLQKVNDFDVITFRLYAWGAASSTGSLAIGRFTEGNSPNSLALNGMVVSSVWQDIDVIDFRGKKDAKNTVLNWTTVTEMNSRGFEIMQSTDGILFTVIDFVPSAAINGSSTEKLHYNFTGPTPKGNVFYYCLRHFAEDGHNKISPVIMIRGDDPKKFRIDGLFPNPVSGQFNVVVEAPVRDRLTLIITDISGRIILQKPVDVEIGANTVSFDTGNLRQGIYYMKMECGGNCETEIIKFIKQ